MANVCRPKIHRGTSMRRSRSPWPAALVGLGLTCLALFPSRVTSQTLPALAAEWDQAAAAAYLDERQTWWRSWPPASRDHETSCVSCHTSLPYALARPSLRAALGETEPAVPEAELVDDVEKRVDGERYQTGAGSWV